MSIGGMHAGCMPLAFFFPYGNNLLNKSEPWPRDHRSIERNQCTVATSTPLDDLHVEGILHGKVTQQIVLQNVTWHTYQALLVEMGDQRASRLTYDQGMLEIKMPSQLHEIINRLLERIVNVLTEELGMSVMALGSMTIDREDLQQGVEPDSCFYIHQATHIDASDPNLAGNVPLDLVIEVNITSASSHRLEVYKRLQVAEVWRYTKQTLQIFHLRHGEYVVCECSLTFPMLSANILWQFVEQGRLSNDYNTVNRAVREWIRTRQQP
jgi:Uma2 family endonuclease